MTKIRFRKEKISIQNIGRQRFWVGIAAGLFSAISISLFFNHSREALRLCTGVFADLLILKENELLFFNYFFSFLATVLGLSISLWIWMGNKIHKRRKDRIYKKLARTNQLLIFWLVLLAVSRMGTILTLVLYGIPGYDNFLNLYPDFWIVFVLTPIVVYMQAWLTVRLVYQAGKWIFISMFISLATAFALQITTTVNQEKVNQAYYHRLEGDYNYLDLEIKIAKEKYGVDFDKQTLEILSKRFTLTSAEQIARVKKAFADDKPVTMDTIILQKIIIRNYKTGRSNYIGKNSLGSWQYALPKDILKQMDYFESSSNETKELFEILKEMIDLVNTPSINRQDYPNYSETERRRSFGANYKIPYPLIEQLKEVRTQLLKDNRYSGNSKLLPEIKGGERRD